MKRKLIFTGFAVCMIVAAKAQSTTPEVIATQGDYFTSAGGAVSWTLGEISTETYAAGGNLLTQGFQQPQLLLTTGIKSSESSLMSVYPNPVVHELTLNLGTAADGKYVIRLFDMAGKEVLSENMEVENNMSAPHSISFENYATGIYLLNITDAKNGTKEFFRISKSE